MNHREVPRQVALLCYLWGMSKGKFIGSITGFLRRNKVAVVILLVSIVLWQIGNFLIDKEAGIISPTATYMRLSGFTLMSLAFVVFFGRHKRILLTNLAVLFTLVLLFEGVCFFLLGSPQKEYKIFELVDLEPDHIATAMGFVPYADSCIAENKIVDGDTIFNVTSNIGHDCERFTPDQDSSKSKYALFFGCSIAFGYGLNDNQTFPYYFQKETGANSYNFAFSGYGTQMMLARLQYQNLREYIPKNEKVGAAYYIFYWDHIERAIGSMARHTQWMHYSPNYELQDGKLVRDRFFKDGRPVRSWFYENFYQSSILKYFDFTFPTKLSDSHFDLVSEMVLEAKREYEKQFGNDSFYVVIYPTYEELDPKLVKAFYAHLKKKGITIIDLNENFKFGPANSIHAHEPHPNAAANQEIAKALRERILEMNAEAVEP